MNNLVVTAILLIGFAGRLVPHLWDFTPVLALALLCGAQLPGRWKFIVPVALMAATDCILGFYPSIFINWIGLAVCVGIGGFLQGSPSWARLTAGSLGAAVSFFLISNFGVWLADYPKTAAGFADCYVMALPFFRNSLISTLVYSYVLIGGYAWMARHALSKHTA